MHGTTSGGVTTAVTMRQRRRGARAASATALQPQPGAEDGVQERRDARQRSRQRERRRSAAQQHGALRLGVVAGVGGELAACCPDASAASKRRQAVRGGRRLRASTRAASLPPPLIGCLAAPATASCSPLAVLPRTLPSRMRHRRAACSPARQLHCRPMQLHAVIHRSCAESNVPSHARRGLGLESGERCRSERQSQREAAPGAHSASARCAAECATSPAGAASRSQDGGSEGRGRIAAPHR